MSDPRLLFIKQCMALAASKALVASGAGKMAIALTWVEEGVEAAALEMGLQGYVHAEYEVRKRYTGRKHVRRHWVYPTTLSGKIGGLYGGRAVLWLPGRRVNGQWRYRRQRGVNGRRSA